MCAVESLLRLCFVVELSLSDLFLISDALLTPPHVRQALFSRALDNDDLLPKIRKPVLITQGAKDAIVNPAISSSTRLASGTRRFT